MKRNFVCFKWMQTIMPTFLLKMSTKCAAFLAKCLPFSQRKPPMSGLSCKHCTARLVNTTFVKCPSVFDHKFCFGCAKQFIQSHRQFAAIHCPSGDKCIGNKEGKGTTNGPWAFMPSELEQILGNDLDIIQFNLERHNHGVEVVLVPSSSTS